MSGDKKRIAVLISGRGSNMKALIEAARAPEFPAEIVLVLSNKSDAPGLESAARASIETLAISHKDFFSREAFDQALVEALEAARIDLVCLAGFMRIFSPVFIKAWQGRTINIHPALLPSFKGLNTHAQALEAGVTIHGCTVHFVTEDLDAGPIIVQAAVPVLGNDTEATLSGRVLAMEHRIYPQALSLVASGQVRIEGCRVVRNKKGSGDQMLISPEPDLQ
ncbi:MAG: phosphoribosylglycinamide formyltransferase [Stappiaceae bacterium]